jgi:hypothetical protein
VINRILILLEELFSYNKFFMFKFQIIYLPKIRLLLEELFLLRFWDKKCSLWKSCSLNKTNTSKNIILIEQLKLVKIYLNQTKLLNGVQLFFLNSKLLLMTLLGIFKNLNLILLNSIKHLNL